MYFLEKVYRAVIQNAVDIAPSGIEVMAGESYGVRFDDPSFKNPAIAVSLGDVETMNIELGSFGTSIPCIYNISAKSRMQRDAILSALYEGLHTSSVQIYSNYSGNIPASGSYVEYTCQFGDYMKIQSLPNFDTENEKFFWVGVIFTDLHVIGI